MTDLPPQAFKKHVTVRLLNKLGEEFDTFQMRSGTNLWVFIRKRGHAIGAACSGVGVCAACSVKVTAVDATDVTAVSAASDFEKESLAKNGKSSGERISCLTRVFSDIVVQADYW